MRGLRLVANMINSREIDDLHIIVQMKCRKFIGDCKDQGIDVIITSTYRDNESQEALYEIGRSRPGRKVTNAKPGYSFHNHRVAFDFVPIVAGKAQWEDIALITKCGHIAEGCGLEWAGRWTRFRELLHCQYTGGLSLNDFIAGKTLDSIIRVA